MFDLTIFLLALAAITMLAVAGWLLSLALRDVSIVDSLWPLFFLAALAVYFHHAEAHPRGILLAAAVLVWAVRLAVYLTWRNHGQPEDRRYRRIRANNSPNFAVKSLYLVFGLQAVLAWVISLPLLAAILSAAPLQWLDAVGFALALFGIAYESIADAQLAGFRAENSGGDTVMDRGLWRYCRHPNYFGEFCCWWGLFLMAAAGGGWWSIVSPLLMSVLLLRVSGVTLLEQDIAERRPQYRLYALRTNAFLPGAPRHQTVQS